MSAISEKQDLVYSHLEYEDMKKFYTGSNWKDRKVRTMTYIREEKASRILLSSMRYVPVAIVGGTMVGVGIGAAAGGPKGAAIGAVTGATVAAIGTGVTTLIVDFTAWKMSNLEGQLKETFLKVQSDHPLLRNYEDPITNEVIIHPVKTPCGHTYDRDSLVAALKKGMNKCAICRKEFKEMKITEDIGAVAAIKKAYSQILKQDIQKIREKAGPDYSDKVLEGFYALRKQYISQVRTHIENASTQLTLELNTKVITAEVWSRKMLEVIELGKNLEEEEKEEFYGEYRVPLNLEPKNCNDAPPGES